MGLFTFNKSTEEKKAKVIALLNQKGGVGKTTLAFNLAYALKAKGEEVLCLDMDPQSNLSLLFGVKNPEYHLFHLLMNSVRELKPLHTPVMALDCLHTKNGVDLIPAGQELSGFELSVAGISAPRQLILKKMLEKSGLLSRYDSIIIDGPPTLGLLVVNILCATDGLLLPFQPDHFSQSGLTNFHEVLAEVADMGIVQAPKVIGYIPNLVMERRKQTSVDFRSIQKELNLQDEPEKLLPMIPNKVQMVKAMAQGKSVFDFKSKEFLPLQEQFNHVANCVQEQL